MVDGPPKIDVSHPHPRASKDSLPATAPPRDGPPNGSFSKPQVNGDGAAPAGEQHEQLKKSTSRFKPNGVPHAATFPANFGLNKNETRESAESVATPPVVDPLSRQIFQRTNANSGPMPKMGRTSDNSITAPAGTNSNEHALGKIHTDGSLPDDLGMAPGTKKKVGILNRLRGHKKSKDIPEVALDETLERTDSRPEGANAQVYQAIDNLGYNPSYPPPPPYIKVRSQGKRESEREFHRLFLAQELHESAAGKLNRSNTGSSFARRKSVKQDGNATWALEFSLDGKYLAAGGQDKTIRVWQTIASREDRRQFEMQEEANNEAGETLPNLSAPVFKTKPVQIYEGHTGPVLDLTWSKNNFLLSTSMDKTVRLWHISRRECLCAFKHNDFVTSVQFHPKDDRFFLAGSLDSKLRLWSIPDKSVAFVNQTPEMITAVAFTPDGKTAIAGCLTGLCLFYETEGLQYQWQMHVKSTHGKNARGSKITGIQSINIPPSDPNGDTKLLITSNDSRVRLYNFRDKSLEVKFKGNENNASQIHARFSDCARYVICGSEDKRVFIWSTKPVDSDKKLKQPVEVFEAHNAVTTVSTLAPTRARQLLSNSEDPIYDICNPPPVTLVSRAEEGSIRSGRQPTENGSIQPTPATAEGGGSFSRPEQTPAYISRSRHMSGNIIVTADSIGAIKVFRQDCAHDKRRGEDASSILSKTFIRRQSSTHGSLNERSRRSSNATQPPGERILSWRQGVQPTQSNGSLRKKGVSLSPVPGILARAGSNRGSPNRSLRQRLPGASPSPARGSDKAPSPTSERSSNRGGPLDRRPDSPLKESEPASDTQEQKEEIVEEYEEPEDVTPSERHNSFTYWREEAWRDQIVGQLNQPKRESVAPPGFGDQSRKSSILRKGSSMLGIPNPFGRRQSNVSDSSILTSEMPSDEEAEKPDKANSPRKR